MDRTRNYKFLPKNYSAIIICICFLVAVIGVRIPASRQIFNMAWIARLAEHWIVVPRVVGSNPTPRPNLSAFPSLSIYLFN